MGKLAIFISHPIQYQIPLYQKLSKKIDLTVYYYSKFGAEKYFDPQFKKEFKWDINLLEGYNYKILKNNSFRQGFHLFGFINLGIFKEIFKNKFDGVLINSWSYLSDWLVILACLISKTKLFLRVESPYNQEILKPKWKLFIKKIIFGKILFPKVHAFLYIGEENRKFFKFYGVPDEKLFFAPYAVDNERFQKEYEKLKDKKEELRKELGIEPDDVVILFVGKLIPKKRPMDLLKAYEIITAIRNTNYNPKYPNAYEFTNNTNEKRLIEKELSYKLTGIFFEIHNELGRFAREKQYADLLEKKLKETNIKYRRELPLKTSNKTSNIFDFIIEDRILIELKRKPVNTPDDYRQIMRYLESTGLELGILVNFGLEYLKPKRILNYKLLKNSDDLHISTNSYYSDYGIHLIYVGEGELRKEMEDYAKEIIRNINYNINYNPKYQTAIRNIRMYTNITNNTNEKNRNEHSDLFVNSDKFVSHSDYGLSHSDDSHIRTNSYNSDYGSYGIHFVGFKNQTEISKYYAMSDIFVLPSDIGETWGLVVNEAMNFRLPVIVSDLVGCGSDLVKHGENGYIFKTGDIEELARYLGEFISYNPKYPNVYEFTNNTNEKNNSLDKFVSHSDYGLSHSDDSHIRTNSYNSDYGSEKRLQFGEKSFEIVRGYNYNKISVSILKVFKI